MTTTRRLDRLRVQLRELEAYRDLATAPLGGAEVHGATGPHARVEVGGAWPDAPSPLTFAFRARVADLPGTDPLWLRLDLGGEGLVRANGVALGGLNPYHRELPLPASLGPGDALEVEVEAVPRGLFGTPSEDARLAAALLVRPDGQARALHEDLAAVVDAATALVEDRPDVAELLVAAAADTLAGLRLPRAGTDAFLARLTRVPLERGVQAGVWEGWRFDGEATVLDDAARARLAAAATALRARLDAVRARYGSEGALVLTGHAHIDLAWLWPLAETRRKAVRTFRTVLTLMDRYPEWTFNQSTAQLYHWLEQDDPQALAAIRRRVEEGRWEVVGGMWVEPDGNLLAGESWARQLLYGQRELERLTGRRASVAWLPDTFGYAANLPQLFRQAGLPYFFTTKLNWNDTDRFPHDLYWWEGLDGSRVLAHSFHNPERNYNGVVQASDTTEVWRRYRGKRYAPDSLFTYGWGDGGGGPTAEMLERFERQRAMPGLPALRHGRADAFFEGVEGSPRAEQLPVWVGEKYLEFHRGTYTTQARLKRLHRRLEHALVEAEAAAALRWRMLAQAYPERELHELWETLLRNEFHDILPGSSIRSVNEEAERELGAALAASAQLGDEALRTLSRAVSPAPAAVVWNLSLRDRPLHLALPGAGPAPAGPSSAGAGLAAALGATVQGYEGAAHVAAPEVSVPGLGYVIVPLGGIVPLGAGAGAPAGAPTDLDADDRRLENAHLLVSVLDDGSILMFDKDAGREVLAAPGNRLRAFDDVPRVYEAWELDVDYPASGRDLPAVAPPRLVTAGPALAAIRVRRAADGLEVEQDYVLRRGSRRLEMRTRLAAHARRTVLRAYFPTTVRASRASYETAFGRTERSTHRNTPWDAAAFEVPGLRWADLSETGYGVGLITDGTYGYATEGSTLSLTLLRTPVHPDPYADEGDHAFTYALVPHLGGTPEATLAEAQDLNAPLRVAFVGAGAEPSTAAQPTASEPTGAGDLTSEAEGAANVASEAAGAANLASARLLGLGGGIALSAIKRSEDGEALIVRAYEPLGARAVGRPTGALLDGSAGGRVALTDLLEERRQEPPSGEVELTPFQVVTLRLGGSTDPGESTDPGGRTGG